VGAVALDEAGHFGLDNLNDRAARRCGALEYALGGDRRAH
jgi:hypothetical protein